MAKGEIILETYFDLDKNPVYQVRRNLMTGEYSFYIPDGDGKLKKKEKSFNGSFEKEKAKYGQAK